MIARLAMLTIRTEQMQAFAAVQRQNFVKTMTTHLLKEFRDEITGVLGTCDEPAVRAFVSHGIDSAFGYGIEDEDDVSSLVEIQAELGTGFETRPGFEWAAKLLNNQRLTSKVKLELLIDGLSGSQS